jgi:diguanylate cyclase (GGDEF)-like protein
MSIVRPDFEKLADRSSDGYFCHRFDDGLVYVSPGFAALAGRSAERLAAPLQVGQAGMGALTVIGGAGQYTEEDLAFLSALAQVGSLALANSSTYRAMERLASIDGLTGAYNRRFFEANLPADVERANRLGYPLSLMMIDIDYLKRINDQRGHVARDRSLQHVVESMRSRIRETDWIARYGGDEFIVLLPGCSAAHLQQLGQDLLSHLRGQDVPGLDVGVRVHSSVGAISAKGGSIIASELIKAVDRAELQAKSKGGDQMVLGTLEADANRPASSA